MSNANELLRRALESFDWMDVDNSVTDDIRAFLAVEPEAEPVGSICLRDETGLFSYVPVYLHPSPQAEQRKPLTEEEMYKEGYKCLGMNGHFAFDKGVRWAEKMHKIGGGDE